MGFNVVCILGHLLMQCSCYALEISFSAVVVASKALQGCVCDNGASGCWIQSFFKFLSIWRLCRLEPGWKSAAAFLVILNSGIDLTQLSYTKTLYPSLILILRSLQCWSSLRHINPCDTFLFNYCKYCHVQKLGLHIVEDFFNRCSIELKFWCALVTFCPQCPVPLLPLW